MDVEGAEALVLESLNSPTGTFFGAMMVEADGRNATKDKRVADLALAAGQMRRANLALFNSQVYLQPKLSEIWPNREWLAKRGQLAKRGFKMTPNQLYEVMVKGTSKVD